MILIGEIWSQNLLNATTLQKKLKEKNKTLEQEMYGWKTSLKELEVNYEASQEQLKRSKDELLNTESKRER
jgi:hypothetical protein